MDRLPVIAGALRLAARRHGTPLYVTDAAVLEASAGRLVRAFGSRWERRYSIKANDLPALVARIHALGFGANVVSLGEWELARRAGVPNSAITLEGIGKTDADLRAAARAAANGEPLRWVSIESAEEAAALAKAVLAADRGPVAWRDDQPDLPVRVDVLLRLNPEVEPETHAGLATGLVCSKFGLLAEELGEAVRAGGGPVGPLRFRGIHLHVGSQLGAVDAWRDAVRRGLTVLALQLGGLPDFDTLDVGGGFPVPPFGEEGPPPERYAREVPELLAAIPADRRPRHLAVEPGRSLVARAGWIVARVLHVRERTGPPPPPPALERSGPLGLAVVPPEARTVDRRLRIVVIDAGLTELIRPALYGAYHAIVPLTSMGRAVTPALPEPAVPERMSASWRAAAADRQARDRALRDARAVAAVARARGWTTARVDGPICESTDTLGEHLLPPLRRGDLVAIRDTGAYAASMRSSYNGRPRPAEALVEKDGEVVLLRRRDAPSRLG